MGKKLTDLDIDGLDNNTGVDTCLVCDGREEHGLQNLIDSQAMLSDTVCDECQNFGTMNASYILKYVEANGMKICGYTLYEDDMAGSVYFHREGDNYSVYATPDWEDSGEAQVSLCTDEGDVDVLGSVGLQGTLQAQANRYVHIVGRLLHDAEEIYKEKFGG